MENQNKDEYRNELDQWTDMWDDMCNSGDLPDPEPPENAGQIMGFGTTPLDVDDNQELYYAALEDQMLSEEKKTPNPVYPDTTGPDCDTTPPVWASEDIVKDITALKDKLFDVENKMAKMGGSDKVTEKAQYEPTDLLDKIRSLRKEIEEASNQLGTEHEAGYGL